MPNNLGLAGSLKKSKKWFIQTSPPPPPPSLLSSPLINPANYWNQCRISGQIFIKLAPPLRYWIKNRSKKEKIV
jgi:hypothetical protein